MIYDNLNPDKALIWRIVHRDNLPWILDHGLHCANSAVRAPGWVRIGNPALVDKRATYPVPVPPGGYLHDYVPFYFTPFSLMMLNLHLGGDGIKRRPNEEIVILVSSLHRVAQLDLPYVFTDSHVYYLWANFYGDLADLDKIDWDLLQRRKFRRSADDPRQLDRYQAEALVHRHLPVAALLGAVCYTERMKAQIEQQVQTRGLTLPVYAETGWYF